MKIVGTVLVILLFLSCRTYKNTRMACLTGDGLTVDFVDTPGNKTCLTKADLETMRGNTDSLNIYLSPIYLDYNTKCIGLYEYILMDKPTRYQDHGYYQYLLKFEDKIELANVPAKADTILAEFFKKYRKKYSALDQKAIKESFKQQGHFTGGF